MSYPIENDIHKITRVIELLTFVNKYKFETPEGKEFLDTINHSIEEVIKPFGRDYIINLRKQLSEQIKQS